MQPEQVAHVSLEFVDALRADYALSALIPHHE
jgi:hypothetical protein